MFQGWIDFQCRHRPGLVVSSKCIIYAALHLGVHAFVYLMSQFLLQKMSTVFHNKNVNKASKFSEKTKQCHSSFILLNDFIQNIGIMIKIIISVVKQNKCELN